MVKNSFIEKTYVVGTQWNCLIVPTIYVFSINEFFTIRQFQCVPSTYVTENKEENYLEIYIFQVSCPLSLHLLNIPNCQSVLKFLSLYCKLSIFA